MIACNASLATGPDITEFWSWAYSDLLSNTVRSIYAEYLVAKALDALEEVRLEWDATDLRYHGYKIEVKASGYLQSWRQAKRSVIEFGIAPQKNGWDARTNTYLGSGRPSHCYVFCVHTDMGREHAAPQDLGRWQFYAIPTSQVNATFRDQKSVRLSRIRALTAGVGYKSL
ncbi:MAG: hypothetical protein EXR52_03690 [Dehalococcoidia bacterium]|nr:hypothetical protein [Dehalococcoidia bacterium]